MTEEQIIELAGNLEIGLRCFVHKEKKVVVTMPNAADEPFVDLELWHDAKEQIQRNFDSYVEIERMNSNESFRLMERFVGTIGDERLRDKLGRALSRPKPFQNFKFQVDHSGPYRQKWFDFKEQELLKWVKERLAVHDL